MGIKVNLGGERLGSGNKMNIDLHTYNRSTHDLSRAWRSSMNVGTLVPCFKEVALPGDNWTINIRNLVRTIPAIGPLYGSYKMQVDFFSCPIRLYNGLLHNNMLNIGLNMSQVKLPKVTLSTTVLNPNTFTGNTENSQIANDSLIKYLGLSGLGDWGIWTSNEEKIERKINAVPILAYYDIYKNYYINKQEKNAYIVMPNPAAVELYLTSLEYGFKDEDSHEWVEERTWGLMQSSESTLPTGVTPAGDTYQQFESPMALENGGEYKMPTPQRFGIENLQFIMSDGQFPATYSAVDLATIFPDYEITDDGINLGQPAATYTGYVFVGVNYEGRGRFGSQILLKSFPTTNIDDARIAILQTTGLNNELDLTSLDYPYKAIWETDGEGFMFNRYSQNGLAIKTYQADIFNSWLQTEWIDGVNGINQITAIDTSSGSFTIDALNLANKVYNMLNRIAVSGGSYEDYIEAVYTTETMRRAESPIYIGGASEEIVFQEVVSTAPTEDNPLGTMAGKGEATNSRGGRIEVKITEPSYIIGICSITPRVDYSQGNDWDLTELDTLDDLHKPALDGIGFQDLLIERMTWHGTYWDPINQRWTKGAMAKTPAWMDYMTAVNKTYGDFADENKCMFMTLNRRYGYNRKGTDPRSRLTDLTTYIDPTKYNYSFADNALSAQNFWVQIGIMAEARRVMSYKQIPNL